MQIGALAGTFDVALLAFLVFFLFFGGLVVYLQRESNREGFPLQDQNGQAMRTQGLSGVPTPKTFVMPTGEIILAPRGEAPEPVNGVAIARFPGAPIEPIGNPLLSGVGPAAFARRADVPDRQFHTGAPRIVPLRADAGYSLALEDADPRGYTMIGADGIAAGTITDVWVDRSESMMRYVEVRLNAMEGARTVLAPTTLVDIHRKSRTVTTDTILAAQFADVPLIKSAEQITLLEEDMISAYFGAGAMYATPARAEPLL